MSFDFARDLMDALEKQGMDYALFTIHKDCSNKKTPEYVISRFESLNDETKKALLIGLQNFQIELEKALAKKTK